MASYYFWMPLHIFLQASSIVADSVDLVLLAAMMLEGNF